MIVLPADSELYAIFDELAQTRRMVFVTGVPGVGKSLWIQQLALLAQQAGRKIHLLQWDVSRQPFETGTIRKRYPEIDGVTHPMIRKAVGSWARTAIVAWNREFTGSEHLLIGEPPLVGNRLSELIEPRDDSAERLLSAPSAEFVVPVPSIEVRAVIEAARARTIAEPQHEKEAQDAPPNVLQALWREIDQLAHKIGLRDSEVDGRYDPAIYGGIYTALLQHRYHRLLSIDQLFRPRGSVYDSVEATSILAATPDEAERVIADIGARLTDDEISASVEEWHAVLTEKTRNEPKR